MARNSQQIRRNSNISAELIQEEIEQQANDDLSSTNYERIKVVGKGAFGTAVLCRRFTDGQEVIVKEIPILALTAGERILALNEAKVLAKLSHPNIVHYYNSYETNGTLMIEMEYADGGNLQEYLSRLESRMDEVTVLNFFQQIASAVTHLHEKHIIHRDLKTANIFLTSKQIVKVGDFGISKVVNTQVTKANTVIGTPYYISPEMCEGKPYNDRSDIWALGCILYEMACLHRTFDATNLPALVQKITKGHFAPIDGDYSQDFRELIRDMLHQEPTFRPSSKEIIENKLPKVMKYLEKQTSKLSENVDCTKKLNVRSVLYFVIFNENSLDLIPIPLPPKISVQKVAVGFDHMMVLSNDSKVYVWGDNARGQLGLGSVVPCVQQPLLLPGLEGKCVTMIGCGDGFSIFACSNGIVMTCGDGSKGCLGHGDRSSTFKPKVLEKLLCVNVSAVECGAHHVVVIGEERWVFAWGCGLNGRLGNGKEESICLPMEIGFPDDVFIRKVCCGDDGTVFISNNGKAWGCGSNAYNKLGLDRCGKFSWNNKQTNQVLVPTRIECVTKPVADASLGTSHSAFLLENGIVITCGKNSDGQLGHEHDRVDRSVTTASLLNTGSRINMISCGDTFTAVGLADNVVLCWGSVYWNYGRSESFSSEVSRSLVFDVSSSDTNMNCSRNGEMGDFNKSSLMVRKMACPEEIVL
ncbi:hypothetical protein CHUAL_011021 [Chamberlinius hualienensis]